MLQLILGRSGSGKTHRIYDELTTSVVKGGAAAHILLVPEQYSFESERALLERLGPQKAGSVRVLSFTRLAETVFRELGGLAGKRMDDCVRSLLLSRALEQVADHLTLYRRQIQDPAAIRSMMTVLTECKQCAISPLMLEEAARSLPASTLRGKTQELSLILSAYEALAAGAYIDPLDDLTLLAQRLPESALLREAAVYVDAFKGFTAQELQVLAVAMRQTSRLTIALCTDTLQDTSGGYGRFSPALRTASRLMRLAQDGGVPVAKPLYLTENWRAENDALRWLEAGAFTPCPDVWEGDAEAVTVTPCADIYGECAWAARTIRRLLREGERCRDIALVARNFADYQGVLDVALEQEGVAYYMDARKDVLTDPLITLVLSALDAVTGGWETEEILRLLKTGLLPFSSQTVAVLENYVFQWRITGSRWKQDWVWNPEGLSVKETKENRLLLERINRQRRRLTEPLERLQNRMKGGRLTGRDFAQGVYRYLTDCRADAMLRYRVRRLEEAGEPSLARNLARIWDVLMELLDKFASALGEAALPAPKLTELFRLACGILDLGEPPQALDAVQVGSADRMRFSHPKTVFILGANEGVFPANPSAQGILTEKEREQLISCGLPITDTGDFQAVEERFYAYMALSAPSQRLFISYIQGNAAGETLSPSSLVGTVEQILPCCRKGKELEEEGGDIESESDAFSRLAALWRTPSPLSSTLRRLFHERSDYQARLAAMERAAAEKPVRFEEADRAAAFFGRELRLSPSRVETYHLCRFAYFCRYGLRAKARRPADLDAAQFGTLAHYVMEKLLPVYAQLGFESIRKKQAMEDTEDAVREYVDTYMGGEENKSSRFAYLLTRLTATCGSLLWQVVLEMRQSRFVPVDYELPIGLPDEEHPEAVEPLRLTLPDGTQVYVQGKVDRVDILKKGDDAYVRVVDYKTGSKEFRLAEVMDGINVQMLIYLMSIWANGGQRYGQVTPAGVLYLPAKLPVVKVDRGADEETAERARVKVMRMNGLLLDNPEIIRDMELDAAGLFIPARLTSTENGEAVAAGSSVASLRQFALIKRRIEKLLTDMAQTLRRGDIAATPALNSRIDACAWCDYRAVCGHEAEDPVRRIREDDTAAVLKELTQEESDAAQSDG